MDRSGWKNPRFAVLLAAITSLGLGVSVMSFASAAQDYPAKPITLIVPFPPGGPTDFSARRLAHMLSARLKEQVVVENRPGASGTIGTRFALAAAPDGYKLFICSATHSANVALDPALGYDPVKDFVPIVRFATVPFILLVNPSVPARTLRELVALAKSQPGKLRYGSAGVATFTHIIGEAFVHEAAIELVHVPYKGGAPAVTDTIGGHIDMVFTTAPDALPQIKGGRLRALAVTGPRRLSALPDIPTMGEGGVNDYNLMGWGGLCGPRGTPRSVIMKLNTESQAAYLAPRTKAELEELGYEVEANTPEEFAKFIREEISRVVELVKRLRIRPES